MRYEVGHLPHYCHRIYSSALDFVLLSHDPEECIRLWLREDTDIPPEGEERERFVCGGCSGVHAGNVRACIVEPAWVRVEFVGIVLQGEEIGIAIESVVAGTLGGAFTIDAP